MKRILEKLLGYYGYRIVRKKDWRALSRFERLSEPLHVLDIVKKNTMLNDLRLINIREVINYISKNRINGAYVECGVWKGGSAAYAAYCLKKADIITPIHLFDVFDDICEPDASVDGDRAIREVGGIDYAQGRLKPVQGVYNRIGYGGPGKDFEVLKMLTSGTIEYPLDFINIHQGWFQDTLPNVASSIGAISVLRLDADWYSSTKVCLESLYQFVVNRGVIIIDDYGAYEGCKKAVDEYLNHIGFSPYLIKVDDECVYFIKTH